MEWRARKTNTMSITSTSMFSVKMILNSSQPILNLLQLLKTAVNSDLPVFYGHLTCTRTSIEVHVGGNLLATQKSYLS